MNLSGDKKSRINALSNYLVYRTQIVLMLVTVISAFFSQITIFGICVILMGIITFSYREVYNFFMIPSQIIIEWKYKYGNYRDSLGAGPRYQVPGEWNVRGLLLDYLMIVIFGLAK